MIGAAEGERRRKCSWIIHFLKFQLLYIYYRLAQKQKRECYKQLIFKNPGHQTVLSWKSWEFLSKKLRTWRHPVDIFRNMLFHNMNWALKYPNALRVGSEQKSLGPKMRDGRGEACFCQPPCQKNGNSILSSTPYFFLLILYLRLTKLRSKRTELWKKKKT